MKKTRTSLFNFNIIKQLAMLFVFTVFIQNMNAQQRGCDSLNVDFCPGNFFQNGDFEIITGDPDAQNHQDINLATGWQAPWQGPQGVQTSLADLHCSNGQQQIGTIPTPSSFVFAGMWIENRPATDTTTATYREGMYNRLATPIAQNTGSYTFNFNIANAMLTQFTNVSIGIYGVFNQGNIPANAPLGSNASPTNINLWQSVNQTGIQPPVLVVLLGTIITPNNFTNTWVPQSVTFSSSSANFPPGGITHILVTAADTARPQTYRKIYVNFDDFCLQRTSSPSVYCCEGDNLITNGNFESGNTGFASQYAYQSTIAGNSVAPGEYAIATSAGANTVSSNWNVQDHTTCENGFNNNFMVVNGETMQASNAQNVIWRQSSISVERDSIYKFCAYLNHLPQPGSTIAPQYPKYKVQISHGSGGTWTDIIPWTTFNYTGSNPAPCDWEEISGTFTATAPVVSIQIMLDEMGMADGNDLAIDDISLQKVQSIEKKYAAFGVSPPVDLGNGNFTITANVALPLPNPDPDTCGFFWEVCEFDFNANSCISSTTVTNPSQWWSPVMTNDFAGYNGTNTLSGTNPGVFSWSKTYRIKRGVWCDCLAWEEFSIDIVPNKSNNLILVRDSRTKKTIKKLRATRQQ